MIKRKKMLFLVLGLFFLSLVICIACYWAAWQGGLIAMIGMFCMSMWVGFARFLQKVIQEM
jgi:1,4-dihydroxy-2-naphthoate octaprenyltransferase